MKSHCFNCGTFTSDDHFCYGCNKYICIACDVGDPMGKHEPEAHLVKIDRDGEVVLTPDVALTIVKFLDYSLEPVDYEWEDLTNQEKALCTKEEFDKMVAWMRGGS